MTRAVVGRAVLVGVALCALAWIGLGLRAVILNDRGVAQLEAADGRPDAATARSARSLFERAARENADPGPELNEAALLISLGRDREAATQLEAVTRDNPGHIRAWGLLAAATARFDDRRSTRASGELLTLYGRVQGEPLPQGAVRSASGRRYLIVPGRIDGVIDASRLTGDRVVFKGWAVGRRRQEPAEILVVSRGRVVQTAVASRPRPDIARKYREPALLRSGFSFSVPLSRLAGEARGEPDVHLLGATGGDASPLRFNCASVHQDLGC